MMKLFKKRFVVLVLLLLPVSSYAGLADLILRILPRAVPPVRSQIVRNLSGSLLGAGGGVHGDTEEDPVGPYDGLLLFASSAFPLFPYESYQAARLEGNEAGGGASSSESYTEDELGQLAGVVETVTFIHATDYEQRVDLRAVPRILAEGSPESEMAGVIDRAIRRLSLDDQGMVPLSVYRAFIEDLREDPFAFLDEDGQSSD